jgi:hypothetical protein
MREAIGGYFGLEMSSPRNNNPHSTAFAVNSGRNALHCILQSLKPVKVLIPRLLCDVILEPFNKLSISYEFYSITKSFRPEEITLEPGSFLLYINYFGVCDSVVEELVRQYPTQIIVDNTQAYFSEPIPGIPTFYSTRKFFGVPDGAYFYGVDFDLSTLPLGKSWNRCTHLLKRIDLSPEEGYPDFKKNDEFISTLEPARMSRLTTAILHSVNYQAVRQSRLKNYAHLHSTLRESNLLSIYLPETSSGISYPYLINFGSKLRNYLIKANIFIPKFWPGEELFSHNIFGELSYSTDIVHIPIDHRCDSISLSYIVDRILAYNTGIC